MYLVQDERLVVTNLVSSLVLSFCSLSENKISDDAIYALSRALEMNQNLQELE